MHEPSFTETWLVFDTTNMLYRSFYAAKSETTDAINGLAVHTALTTLNKYYKKFTPTKVVVAFDRHSWRKDFSADPARITKRPYKGNRRQDLTPGQQEKYAAFVAHCAQFEALITDHTTMTTLAGPSLEADDLIGGICQYHNAPHRRIIVISTDSDLWQLTQYQNVQIMSPATDKFQALDDFDNDPMYYVFSKCIRGDPTDNIMSAFPRVRQTVIKDAYTDAYKRTELMQSTWMLDGATVTVGDVFAENQVLISLAHQPDVIKTAVKDTILAALEKPKKFSLREFLRFLGQLQLKRIIDGIDNYVDLLGRK